MCYIKRQQQDWIENKGKLLLEEKIFKNEQEMKTLSPEEFFKKIFLHLKKTNKIDVKKNGDIVVKQDKDLITHSFLKSIYAGERYRSERKR